MKKIRLMLVLGMFLSLILALTPVATAATPGFGSVTEDFSNFKFEVAPGSVIIEEVTLLNYEETMNIALKSAVTPATPDPANPAQISLPMEWVQISVPGTVDIASGKSEKIYVTISVPETAKEGTYVGFFSTKLEKNSSGTEEAGNAGASVESTPAIGSDIVVKVNPALAPTLQNLEEVAKASEVGNPAGVWAKFRSLYQSVDTYVEIILLILAVILIIKVAGYNKSKTKK
jgi:hypothetical protein